MSSISRRADSESGSPRRTDTGLPSGRPLHTPQSVQPRGSPSPRSAFVLQTRAIGSRCGATALREDFDTNGSGYSPGWAFRSIELNGASLVSFVTHDHRETRPSRLLPP